MKIKALSVGLLVLPMMGCLESPLLNHADAAPKTDLRTTEERTVCPILFEKEKTCASLNWVRMPADGDKGEFTLRFWSQESGTENGPYIDPGHAVFVKLWMSSMGHGSSPVRTTQARDSGGIVVPGVFDVTDVYFVMPGAWQIIVQLKQDAQVIDQAAYDVEI